MEEKPDGQTSALEDARVQALNTRTLLAFCVVTACLLVTVAAAWIIPTALDKRNLAHSRSLLQQALAAEGERLGQAALEHSYWNEAVEKVIYEQNAAWADSELGAYLQQTYGVRNLRAEDRDGNRRYTYAADDSDTRSLWERSRSRLDRLATEVLATPPKSPEHDFAYTVTDGTLHLVVASPFIAYQPSSLDTSRPHGVLFMARVIDEGVLSEWSSQYGLPDLDIAPAGQAEPDAGKASIAVTGIEGEPIARLEWQPDRPGRAMLARAAPWGLSVGIVFLMAATVVIMNLEKLVRLARGKITELDQQQRKLFEQAMFDDVSNLHNRNYLISRLEEELSRIRRTATSSIFIFLDLDGFKMVNDTMGHSAGDDLLRQVGQRLVGSVRTEDVVCRFGGDEFCLLITALEPAKTGDIREVAEKISHTVLEQLERPFTVDDKPVNIGASAGIVIIPDDTTNIEDILRFGDLAMYKAKLVSGNQFIYYERDFLHDINYRDAVRHKLESAIPRNEFALHYQPIHDIASQRIVGFEALARWDSDDLGVIRPGQFIAIAEESDTIIRLGRWIIDKALRDAHALCELAGSPCFIAINISGKQFADPEFCEYLEQRMDVHGVDPVNIHLELTESYRFRSDMDGLQMLHALRSRGIHISLDDFGTGYASLSWLQQYPLSTVKIDHSVVANVMEDVKMEGIIRAVVKMAESLGIRVVAEGVETAEQHQALAAVGCHWAQGFYYAKPRSIRSLQQTLTPGQTDR